MACSSDKMRTVRVNDRGQVVIPEEIRVDLEEGELPLESMVRADKVLPIEKGLVDEERILGTLAPEAYDRVVERIQDLLARPED